MNKSHLFTFIFIFAVSILFAQTPPPEFIPGLSDPSNNVMSGTPNAQEFQKYTDVPVGYYTGTPSVSIPLYEIDGGSFSVPVSLSYHASGVRVNDISNWVGLGWNLNAGGMISRTIMNLADEIYLFNHKIENPLTNVPTTQMFQELGNWTGNPNPNVDGQHDIFNFNFNGYSGKFLIDNQQVVLIDQQDLKITYDMAQSPNSLFTEFKNFTIIDPQGLQYKFGNTYVEYSKIDGTCGSGGFSIPNRSKIYPTGWMLYEIYDPKSLDKVLFSYTSSLLNYDIEDEKTVIWGKQFGTPNTANYCPGREEINICGYSKLETSYVLSAIICPSGKIEIDNQGKRPDMVSGNQRLKSIACFDGIGSLIKTFSFTQSFGEAELQNSTDFNTANAKRMFLLSFQEKDVLGVVLPPYTFSYKNKSSLPTRFSFAQDYWGYYNGKNNTSFFPWIGNLDNNFKYNFADREPVASKMDAGVLEKISYPTGGETNFEYEPNAYYFNANDNITISSVYNLSSLMPIDDDYDPEIGGYYSVGSNGETILEKSFVPANNQDVSFSYYVKKLTKDPGSALIKLKSNGSIIKLWTVDNPLLLPPNTNPCGSMKEKNGNETVSLIGGQTYIIEMSSKYSCANPQNSEIATLNFQLDELKTKYIKNKMCGGIRIKKISFKETSNSSNILTKRYVYANTVPLDITNYLQSGISLNNINDNLNSSGINTGNIPIYFYANQYKSYYNTSISVPGLSSQTVEACGTSIVNCGEQPNNICTYYVLHSNSKTPLTNNAGNTVVYKRVFELLGENQDLGGMNEYNYNYVPDEEAFYLKGCSGPALHPPKQDNSWQSGKMTMKNTYLFKPNKTFLLKIREQFGFVENNVNHPKNYVYNIVCGFDIDLFLKTKDCNQTIPDIIGLKAYYWPNVSGFLPQTLYRKVVFDDNGDSLVTKINTDFNSNYHHFPTKKTTIAQDKTEQLEYFTYAPDLYHGQFLANLCSQAAGLAIIDMYQKNNVAPILAYRITQKFPIINSSTFNYDIDNTNEKTLLAAHINYSYNTHKPISFLKTEYLIPQPIATFQNAYFNNAYNLVLDPTLTTQKIFEYNNTGNIISVKAKDLVTSAYVWKPFGNTYNGTFLANKIPVAQIINADISKVRYMSFEDTETPTELSFTTAARTLASNTTTNIAKSGNYYYNLTATANTISINQLPPGKYIVSCWYKPIDYARKPIINLPVGATSYRVVDDYANTKDDNGWAYSEIAVDLSTQASPQNISMYYTPASGNIYIDELRVHPLDAQMTTYIYDSNKNIKQIFDINGIPIQYDYDSFQRLQNIRDQDLNILNTFKYNYKP